MRPRKEHEDELQNQIEKIAKSCGVSPMDEIGEATAKALSLLDRRLQEIELRLEKDEKG